MLSVEQPSQRPALQRLQTLTRSPLSSVSRPIADGHYLPTTGQRVSVGLGGWLDQNSSLSPAAMKQGRLNFG